LNREPPFHVGGAFCTPCVNTAQGTSLLLADIGCPANIPFCINEDQTEPALNEGGQTCTAVHPSEANTDIQDPPTRSPIAEPTASPVVAPTQEPEPEIDFDEGLPCDLGLTFNPVDADYPQMIDNGDNTCTLRMTPDSGPYVAASAFTTHTFEPSNTMRAFSMSLGYRIYGDSYGSADGIAFVMHQDERGVNALGGPGGYMGVYHGHGSEKGIYPALVIEFDTYPNPGQLMDNGQNNIHITTVSADGTIGEIAESSGVDIRTDRSGSPAGKLWVEYCQDKMIRIFLNNQGDVKPAQELFSAFVDLDSIFTSQSVTLGYTAATGGQKDFHDITSWSFKEQCEI
jgi:hypothetical protein